jgi:hypothetical protein
MKNRVVLFFVVVTASFNSYLSVAQGLWHRTDQEQLSKSTQTIRPLHFLVYRADETPLRLTLANLSAKYEDAVIVALPLPDGTSRQFRVWRNPLLPGRLATKYPELMTFSGEAADDPHVTAKLDLTLYGFHAMIFDGNNTSFIDPYNNFHDGYYLVHYKRDETREQQKKMKCAVSPDFHANNPEKNRGQKKSSRTANGYVLRTYRLALACDHFYAQAATNLDSPTIAQVLSKMTTSMNRVNGIYERELSVSMIFADNEDTLIWTTDTSAVNGPDPYSSYDGSAYQCLITNQSVCDARIGNANYDIGHVFTTGAGGLSQVGVACEASYKAQSVTGQHDPVGDGFDVDYVSHEMGHEYGADHPFNSSDGNCGGDNLYPPMAYEPGSGSTIMAYAGICNPDDLQPHSDAYFHSASLEQIQNYITTIGDVCAVKAPTGNKLESIPSFAASYAIPYLTPFEITAPAVADSVADTSITYCWEQWDLGDAGTSFLNTHQYGPIFRSFTPVKSATRIFPRNSLVLSGDLSDAGTEDAEGEKAPDVGRFLTFQLTMRDIYQGNGCFLIPDDTVHLDVINTGEGFKVTSQNTSGVYYVGSSPETITWNVAGSNASPINTSAVDIYMSADGGNSWQYHIGTFPNTGSAVVTLPNPDTDLHAARIKVKGNGNVFFNVNAADFTVAHSLASDSDIVIYPVPVHNVLRMFGGNKGTLQTVIYNAIGQQVWKGQVDGETDIPILLWAPGVYFVKMIDVENHHTIRKIVVE